MRWCSLDDIAPSVRRIERIALSFAVSHANNDCDGMEAINLNLTDLSMCIAFNTPIGSHFRASKVAKAAGAFACHVSPVGSSPKAKVAGEC